MNEQRIIELLEGGNANFQVPVKFQLDLLGLDKKAIKRLKGKKGLDIACGKGFLVEDLRSKGILFEGIDFEAPKDKHYFIPQNVTSVHPLMGSIPREDSSYDIVTVFQCGALNRSFTWGGIVRTAIETRGEGGNDEWYTTRYQQAQSVIYEATRVAKPGCKVIAYPSLIRLEETMGPLLRLQGIKFYTEPVNKQVAKEYLETEGPLSITEILDDYCKTFGLLERTVLVKDK